MIELNDSEIKGYYEASKRYLKLLEEVHFHGSPSDFISAARGAQSKGYIPYGTEKSVGVWFSNDSGVKVIYFYNPGFGIPFSGRPYKEQTLAAYGSIEAIPAPNNQTLVSIYYDYTFSPQWSQSLKRWWEQLRNGIEAQGWKFATGTAENGLGTNNRGMSEWRTCRAYLFKRLKDGNRRLTQVGVASEATLQEYEIITQELSQIQPALNQAMLEKERNIKFNEKWHTSKNCFTKEDVRNDYKTLKWEWESANKIR